MKFQPKRFVVEVKRGTSRAAFASPDPSPDRFSSAEAMLFGESPKTGPKPARQAITQGEAAAGRVLPSLVEPPPPVVEDEPEPVRRGRKPGSKNKPKLHLASSEPDSIADRPRRGRKPGSKNKPKLLVTAASPAPSGRAPVAASATRSFGDDGISWREMQTTEPPEPSRAERPATDPANQDAGETRTGALRPRLRERSTILRRYVLDLEPRAGQAGALRARRLARAAR